MPPHGIRSWTPLRDLSGDVRFGLRLLWRERWFALTAIVTLALAMGMSNTVYTVANAMILRGLPVAHPDRIVTFNDRSPNTFALNVSYREIEDWREKTSSFAEIALWSSTLVTINDEGQSADVIGGSYVSASIFRVVEQQPILGRDFLANDEQPGAAPVVILGYSVWASRYGSDPTVVGRTVRLNDKPATIIGVMPQGFRFPLIDDIWMPVAAMPGFERQRRDARPFRACGRLRSGVSMSAANAELAAVTTRLAAELPDDSRSVRVGVLPYTGTVSYPMYRALFGAVACLLLIACSNVSNLLLARSERRTNEVAVRMALGASRWRVVRQMLVESVIVAVLAAACGFLLSLAGVKAFAYAVEGINFPYWYRDRWTMDHRVFAFMAIVCVATAFAFGLVPALQVARRDVQRRLKQEGRTIAGGSHVWTNTLLTLELTVALMLLVAAGLMVRSFLAEYRADSIADARHVLTVSLRLPAALVRTSDERIALYRRVEERLRSSPAMLAVAFANTPPYIGGPMYDIARDEHRPTDRPAKHASVVFADAGYFDALNVRLLRGRALEDQDGLGGHEAVVVNQQFADTFFPGENPLSQRICAFAPDSRAAAPLCGRVVGISPTVRQQFMSDLDPVIYLPLRVNPASAMLLVRSTDLSAAATAVRTDVNAVEPTAVIWRMMPLETWMQQSRWGYRVFGTMFSVFAAIALALSAVGIYAVTAFSVIERTREIGIRIALGSPAVGIVQLFLRRKLGPIVVGLALGLAGALGVGRLVQAMLVRTSRTDPLTLVSVGGLLAGVAMCAVLIPAVRASRIQPSEALRHE